MPRTRDTVNRLAVISFFELWQKFSYELIILAAEHLKSMKTDMQHLYSGALIYKSLSLMRMPCSEHQSTCFQAEFTARCSGNQDKQCFSSWYLQF
jgi:hypothetical protein